MKQQLIAIVDDDAIALESIKMCLSKDLHDTEILTYTSGFDFLKDFSNKDIQLIVTDLEMPAMDGVSLIREVKSFRRSIPIVVLTGNHQILNDAWDVQKYIFEILIKPVEYKQLLRIIKDGLACSEFYNPPKESRTSLDDQIASSKLLDELLNLNQDLRKEAFKQVLNPSEIIRLLNSQQRLLRVISNKRSR
ncbi:MAG: response regulator [Candidatus Aureabacteria bacterium]|nr:response regulator [Candidatus Auribacterota bacterium]